MREHIPLQEARVLPPGTEVVFFNTQYTLLEPTGGWTACESNNPNAKPRVILSEYFEKEVGNAQHS